MSAQPFVPERTRSQRKTIAIWLIGVGLFFAFVPIYYLFFILGISYTFLMSVCVAITELLVGLLGFYLLPKTTLSTPIRRIWLWGWGAWAGTKLIQSVVFALAFGEPFVIPMEIYGPVTTVSWLVCVIGYLLFIYSTTIPEQNGFRFRWTAAIRTVFSLVLLYSVSNRFYGPLWDQEASFDGSTLNNIIGSIIFIALFIYSLKAFSAVIRSECFGELPMPKGRVRKSIFVKPVIAAVGAAVVCCGLMYLYMDYFRLF